MRTRRARARFDGVLSSLGPLDSIRNMDVENASAASVAALDESFFRVRFDRLTPVEKRYLRAMAELGPGPHRSGDIAAALGREVTSLGPTRSQLIAKGMIWSPHHGDTAFTVPLFEEFMQTDHARRRLESVTLKLALGALIAPRDDQDQVQASLASE